MNALYVIMHRIDVGIFDPSKKITAVTKIKTKVSDRHCSHIHVHVSPKPLALAKFFSAAEMILII